MRGVINLGVLTRKMSVNQELRLAASTKMVRLHYQKFAAMFAPDWATTGQIVEAFRLFLAAVFSADTATENAYIDCLQDLDQDEKRIRTRLSDARANIRINGDEWVAGFKSAMRRFHFM